MWFSTVEGLSRFDGYRFTNYGLEIGLPRAFVLDILETRRGDYLVATSDGVCRMQSGHPKCEVIRPDDSEARVVNVLVEDRDGIVWAGTTHGLYRLEIRAERWVMQRVDLGTEPPDVNAIFQDQYGAIWIAADNGLYRRPPQGSFEYYDQRNGLPPRAHIVDVTQDASGQIWAGSAGGGLYQIVRDPAPGRNIVERIFTARDGLQSTWVQGLLRTRSDRFLVASSSEVSDWTQIPRRGRRPPLILHDRDDVTALFGDREGGVWIAVRGKGVGRIPNNGFTTFTRADGLVGDRIDGILENQAGQLCVVTKITPHDQVTKALGCFDSGHFRMVYPAFPANIGYYGWGWSQIAFQDHAGDWWFAGGEGLYRFPAVARLDDLANTPPRTVYRTTDGLPADDIFRLYQDTRGDVWIGSGDQVVQWDRASSAFHRRLLPEGMVSDQTASAFADDERGGIWIGYWWGRMARWRDGRLTLLTQSDGAPTSRPNHIFRDRKGRLWIATSREGVARVDDPAAERPRFQWITTAQGLGSDTAFCIAEDRWNRIYIAHGRGVDRLDPANGKIRRFTTADGLATGELASCYGARDGTLWFATVTGLSRLIPEPDNQTPAPPAHVTGLYLRGVAQALDLHGAGGRRLDLASDQNQLQIDFAAISFNEPLQYQYKLEGSGGDWSEPANTRSVNFASLAPGSYTFLVRAVNAQGLSGEPAFVSFNIAPPLWRRWWAETAAALILAMVVYGVHRYRVRYLLAVERVRTRIASDLHDDIGANLSQIAILSEIARRGGGSNPDGPLAKIAQVSRETLRSMSDIIWAVDPERDRLSELIHRMRRFSADLLASAGIDLQFQANAPDAELGSDVRRQVFLIYKEALNNAARHSGATRVDVEVRIDEGALVVRVGDNGRGFDPAGEHEGNGLANMRGRAQELEGTLEIRSDGTGSAVILRVPLAGRFRSWPLHAHVAAPD